MATRFVATEECDASEEFKKLMLIVKRRHRHNRKSGRTSRQSTYKRLLNNASQAN
jgi:NAD(P)H-dependent flavin oxidoreductase YrpB (nitropropane dioxygenase family)